MIYPLTRERMTSVLLPEEDNGERGYYDFYDRQNDNPFNIQDI